MSTKLPGPLMIDIAGTELNDLDRERLCHPLVGGIILFTRNYRDRAQLTTLCDEIHALREPRLLIAVDHEGAGCSASATASPGCRRCAPLASCTTAIRLPHWTPPAPPVSCSPPSCAPAALITRSRRCLTSITGRRG